MMHLVARPATLTRPCFASNPPARFGSRPAAWVEDMAQPSPGEMSTRLASDRIEQGVFAEKFQLPLEALNWSRTRCAGELGVDKSVVSRWASGAARPTEHNPTRFTAMLRKRSLLARYIFAVGAFSNERPYANA